LWALLADRDARAGLTQTFWRFQIMSRVGFTQEEIVQIVDAATGHYEGLFHLTGYTGLRW
jgi:hypothetical protein